MLMLTEVNFINGLCALEKVLNALFLNYKTKVYQSLMYLKS